MKLEIGPVLVLMNRLLRAGAERIGGDLSVSYSDTVTELRDKVNRSIEELMAASRYRNS